MNRSLISSVFMISLAWASLSQAVSGRGQTNGASSTASIDGTVCDAEHHPIAGVTVILKDATSSKSISLVTDLRGHFTFARLAAGTYTVHARREQFSEAVEGPFTLSERDAKAVTLLLQKDLPREPAKGVMTDMPFSDETHFTVAGVTDTTSLGGHGSDPVRRNSDALSKETAHLADVNPRALDEAAIRDQLAQGDNADLRFQLAEIEERSGRSLEAVSDYQRAAQLALTEPHLFAWGAELLLHRAFDPSIEVFSKGSRLYPDSVRIRLGLGAANYAKGSSADAMRIFLQASDIDPSNPEPYLFLGRVQMTENELPAGWTNRLKRFVDLDPKNAQAHYFYAVALTKKPSGPEELAIAESQLKIAVGLDPHFGDAYLELGALVSQDGDLSRAVAYLQKAVENTALPDQAHYRLAQVYRRMGEAEKAQQETELYKQASEKKKQQVEQERRGLPQFVYTLREQTSTSPNSAPPK